MKKIESVNSIELILIIMLFFSITVLMLNSILPTVALKNTDNPEELIYFNLESMQYSLNKNIQNSYNDINFINNLIWLTIIFILIALFGIILNLSDIYKKISYLLLSFGCLSIIFCSISCYLFISYISKINNFNDILLAYLIVEPVRYSYFILIILILIILFAISYNIITLPVLLRTFKDIILKKQMRTLDQHFIKPVEQVVIPINKKEYINMDFYFKRNNELTKNWSPNKNDKIETKDDLFKNNIKKETTDKTSPTKTNIEYSKEKESPFLENFKKEETKQKKEETDKIKFSETFENALFSAVDKRKKKKK